MDDMRHSLPQTPKLQNQTKKVTRRVSPTPFSAESFTVDSPLDTRNRDVWTVSQLEQSGAAQALFTPVGHSRRGASSYTARDFIKEAVTFLSPSYSARQKRSIFKSMCKHYEHLLVDLSASAPMQWTAAIEDGHVEDAFTRFLKTFAKVAYAKTLTTHRMSIRSTYEASTSLVRQHAAHHRASPIRRAPAPTSLVQASPFSISSSLATRIFEPFDLSSPLQPQTPFTPVFTPMITGLYPEFGFPTTPSHEAVQFFNSILESRSQRIINMEFKLDYLNVECARRDACIAELEDAASDDAPAQHPQRSFFDGLRGGMALDKLHHLGQRISVLRHEIYCTELLIELKDMRIAQLQAMLHADAAFDSTQETGSMFKQSRTAQVEEPLGEAENDDAQSEASASLDFTDDGRPSSALTTLNPVIAHELDSTINSAGSSLASRSDNEDQTLLINEQVCNATLIEDDY